MDGVILAATGLLIAAFGITVWRGRTEVLAQYPDKDGPEELATRAGSVLTTYGVVTVGAAGVASRTDGSTILWIGWTLLTILVAFGVAGLAASYR